MDFDLDGLAEGVVGSEHRSICILSRNDGIGTLGCHPCRGFLIIGGQSGLLNGYGQFLLLAGLEQLCLSIAFELPGGLVEVSFGSMAINLHHFLAGTLAAIGYREAHLQPIAFILDLEVLIIKRGVAQSVAEGIGYLDILGQVVAIAYVDALLIVREVNIGHQVLRLSSNIAVEGVVLVFVGLDSWKISKGGIVLILHGHGDGQSAGGALIAYQHIAHAVAPLLAGLPADKDGIGQITP